MDFDIARVYMCVRVFCMCSHYISASQNIYRRKPVAIAIAFSEMPPYINRIAPHDAFRSIAMSLIATIYF